MKRNQKNESIFENLDILKKGLISLKEKEDSQDLVNYITITEELTKAFKGLLWLTIILLVAVSISIGAVILTKIYSTKVEEFNMEIKDHRNDSIVRQILDIKEIKNGDEISTSYNYLTRNNKIITYNQLKLENDSLNKIIKKLEEKIANIETNNENLENEINLAKDKLNLASDNYDIKFIEHEKSIEIVGKKIDSGFILLQAYRDKMQYNEKEKSWTIKK